MNKVWKFKLKARNSAGSTGYQTLGAGSYDPDHDGNASNAVSYQENFSFTLPDITTTGSMALMSTSLGFNLFIGGNK